MTRKSFFQTISTALVGIVGLSWFKPKVEAEPKTIHCKVFVAKTLLGRELAALWPDGVICERCWIKWEDERDDLDFSGYSVFTYCIFQNYAPKLNRGGAIIHCIVEGAAKSYVCGASFYHCTFSNAGGR